MFCTALPPPPRDTDDLKLGIIAQRDVDIINNGL